MGPCLSSLRPKVEDNEYDERTSLLGEGHYADQDFQNELLRQQQRQNELSVIVNDLSENLIDVSMFLNSNGTTSQTVNPQMVESEAGDEDFDQSSPIPPSAGPETREKHYPKVWSVEEKIQLLRDMGKESITLDIARPKDAMYVEL